MNKTLYFLSYNNYYNRIIKRENRLADYRRYALATLLDTNWNPNDGIHAQHIVNADFSEGTPDYLVVALGENIESRWFVLEATRKLAGQYELIMLRDVVADYYDKILNAPMAIERCIVPDSSPYIFNDEGMSFNQVKKNSTLLKDSTKTPWYVAYITNSPLSIDQSTINMGGELGSYDYSIASLSDFPFYQYLDIGGGISMRAHDSLRSFGIYSNNNNNINAKNFVQFKNGIILSQQNPGGDVVPSQTYLSKIQLKPTDGGLTKTAIEQSLAQSFRPFQTSLYNTQRETEAFSNTADVEALRVWDGKIIYVRDTDQYYRLSFSVTESSFTKFIDMFAGETQTMIERAVTTASLYPDGIEWKGWQTTPPTQQPIFWTVDFTSYKLVASVVTLQSGDYSYQLSSTRNKLNDAPYNMLAIPAEGQVVVNGSVININPAISKQAITALCDTLQINQFLYDVQLLPYCPFRNFDNEGRFTTTGLEVNIDYAPIMNSNDGVVGVVAFPKTSSFSFEIGCNLPIVNAKVQSATEFHRLCSPNYSGIFEFNAAMNGGVSKLVVECTYKPYNPYIYLAPDFGNLYGRTYEYEQRGLVCAGDFSLPVVSDAWRQYELNNKNYQTTFDRGIQNLETNRDIERTREKWAYGVGIFQSTATGIGAGAAMGSLGGGATAFAGGFLGGVVGGASSALAGLADMRFNEKLYQEQVDYQTDIFHLQMQNIRALPQSLTRIGAFVVNNPVFPILEFYSATDEEKEEFSEYINYRSMRAGFVGTIREYQQSTPTFMSGSPLRITGIDEDAHILIQISNELQKGVYI